jgi:hypothetical protein
MTRGDKGGHSICEFVCCVATIAGAVRIASRLLACCRQATSPHRAQSGALRNFELHPQSAVSPEGQCVRKCAAHCEGIFPLPHGRGS